MICILYSHGAPLLPNDFWRRCYLKSSCFLINRSCEHSEGKEGEASFCCFCIYPKKRCFCYLVNDLKASKLSRGCSFIFWRMYEHPLLGLLSHTIFFLIWPHCLPLQLYTIHVGKLYPTSLFWEVEKCPFSWKKMWRPLILNVTISRS